MNRKNIRMKKLAVIMTMLLFTGLAGIDVMAATIVMTNSCKAFVTITVYKDRGGMYKLDERTLTTNETHTVKTGGCPRLIETNSTVCGETHRYFYPSGCNSMRLDITEGRAACSFSFVE